MSNLNFFLQSANSTDHGFIIQDPNVFFGAGGSGEPGADPVWVEGLIETPSSWRQVSAAIHSEKENWQFYLNVLDAGGGHLGHYGISAPRGLEIVSRDPCIVRIAGYSQAAATKSFSIWEMYADGLIKQEGSWLKLDSELRWSWLDVASQLSPKNSSVKGSLSLDGSSVRSGVDFYCALGEAVFGPVGYAGWNYWAMSERMREITPGNRFVVKHGRVLKEHVSNFLWNDFVDALSKNHVRVECES